MRYRNEDAIDGAEISSPRKDFFWVHGAAVGERTESERREDENDRARVPIIERAKCICRLGVFECVRECACSEDFVLLLKGETLQLKSRAKKGRFVLDDSSLSNLFFFFRDFASPEERERERVLVARFNKREKERRGGR